MMGNGPGNRRWGWIAAVLLLLAGSPVTAQKFHPDDPAWLDNDRLIDVAGEPGELELSDFYDRFGHMLLNLGDPNFSEALNVNTLDEVPNSSWFTNRHARERLSIAELVRGANLDGPPDTENAWTIFRGKSQGITPGFSIEDSQGRRYVIKFDPFDIPELATAAESVASTIFYALGYNVPQNYVVRVHPDRFQIKEGTLVADTWGDKVPLTPFRLKRMLRRVPRLADGTIRVTASRYIEGYPIGPFRYFGTRSDDPNDVIPHEHRRELRGLRLFAAWTNHDDTRAQNTQDSWVQKDGKHFIRHYLMDFGSTFGSGSVVIQLPYLGFSYSIDFADMKHNSLRFGFNTPTYRKVDWPKFPKHKAVGRFESEYFDPASWNNDYPNPAFVRMTARDAFWAAKILMAFSEEELLEIVKTGEYSEPADTKLFHRVLVERQRKCGQWGIQLLNPLDLFRVEGEALKFSNLSEAHGFTQPGSTRYEISWATYDNLVQTKLEVREASPLETTEAVLPVGLKASGNRLLLAEIRSLHPDHPGWKSKVSVYLRSDGSSLEIVGIERESPAEPIPM